MKVIFALFLSFSFNTQSVDKLDRKIHAVLKRELKASADLIKVKKNARNYFRYYNSRIELLKLNSKAVRETKFKKSLKSTYTQVLDQKQRVFFKKTKKIGDFIIKKYPNFKDIGKLHLIQGLLVHQFHDDSPEIETNLTKAFDKSQKPGLKALAASKLGDYLFNIKKYKKASIYYSAALKLEPKCIDREKWYHHLAVSEFKQGKYDYAIRNLEAILYKAKDKSDKNYYYTQAVRLIPEFYVFAGKPDRGFKFINQYKSKNYFSFVKYVYSKGYFGKFNIFIREIDQKLQRSKQNAELRAFRVDIYNYLANSEYQKNRNLMIYLRKKVSGYYKSNLLDKNQKSDFKNSTFALLQKNIDFINLKKEKNVDSKSRSILKDTINLLDTLTYIDPAQKYAYELRKAQIYNKHGSKVKAITYLESSYKASKGNVKKKTESIQSLEEIVAYYDAKKVDSPKKKYYFQEYLKHGKDLANKKIIYLKLYDLNYKEGKYKESLEILQAFNKEFPKSTSPSESMTLKLLTDAKVRENTQLFTEVKSFINQSPNLKNSREIQKGLNQNLKIKKINRINEIIAKKEFEQKDAKELELLFLDNDLDKVNRMVAGLNSFKIYELKGNVIKSLEVAKNFLRKSGQQEFLNYESEVSSLGYKYLESHPVEVGDLLSYHFKQSCQNQSSQRGEDFERLIEILLMTKNLKRLGAIVSLGQKCGLDQISYQKMYSLILEYSNFNKISEVQALYLVLNKPNILSDLSERYLQEYLFFEINKVESEDVGAIYQKLTYLRTKLSAGGSIVFHSALNVLSNVKGKINFKFQNEINESTVERFLDTNLGLITSKLKKYDEVQSKFELVNMLIQLSKLKHLKMFEEFIELSKKNISDKPIESIVSGVSAPFFEKGRELEASIDKIAFSRNRLRFNYVGKFSIDPHQRNNYEVSP